MDRFFSSSSNKLVFSFKNRSRTGKTDDLSSPGCDPSLEPSHGDSSNKESQHKFLLRKRKIIFELSSIPLLSGAVLVLVNCLGSLVYPGLVWLG